MRCDKCNLEIASGDERNHHNQTFCEDCYMVALSPMKTCDPWAVHSAKNYEKFGGDAQQLTSTQSKILKILQNDGPMEPSTLQERLGGQMQITDLEREFATLRHMEKVKAEKQNEKKLWRLWK